MEYGLICGRTVHANQLGDIPYRCEKKATHLCEGIPMCSKHSKHWYEKMNGKVKRGEIESFNFVSITNMS